MDNLAYQAKTPGATARNESIQQARDALTCQCGHLNISHGYGHGAPRTWPDGSRIGLGECGMQGCSCTAFMEGSA